MAQTSVYVWHANLESWKFWLVKQLLINGQSMVKWQSINGHLAVMPLVGGTSVNPITTRGADYAQHITASPPGFENPAASLLRMSCDQATTPKHDQNNQTLNQPKLIWVDTTSWSLVLQLCSQVQLALSYETTHNIVAFSVLSVIFHNFRSNIFHNFVDCLPENSSKEKALTH